MKRCVIALSVLSVLLFLLAGCAGEPSGSGSPAAGEPTPAQPAETPGAAETPAQTELSTWPPEREPKTLAELTANTIQATITMEDGGTITLELFPDLAPQSVRNFVELARQGFYDGLKFHRIISGFMIQGGDPQGDGGGGPGYSIRGEYEENGFVNELRHSRSILSMARRGNPQFDSAGSQFFIVHGDSHFLDGSYAGFGRVINGMDVVDRIAETPVIDGNGSVDEANKPIIRTITIDSDIDLPPPDKIYG